jgi:hypothetical protein
MKLQLISRDEACRLMAGLAQSPKTDTSGGISSVSDFIGDGVSFLLTEQDGKPLAAFSVLKIQREHGCALEVCAAQHLGGRIDLTGTVLPEIERQFGHGCDVVNIYTRRPGLMRKLEKAGYEPVATIMQKKLKGVGDGR